MRIVGVRWLVATIATCLVIGSALAQEVDFVRVIGERPSVYGRPVIDDRYLVGQARSGDEFAMIREYAGDLPQAFLQILYRDRIGWIYGGSVERIQKDGSALSSDESETIARVLRPPAERIGTEIRALLSAYDRERERVAEAYELESLPRLSLRAEDAFAIDQVSSMIEVHLEIVGDDRYLVLRGADRLLFQVVMMSVLERMAEVDTCRLVLHFDRRPDDVPKLTLDRFELGNATDLSVDAFWPLVETQASEQLWEEP